MELDAAVDATVHCVCCGLRAPVHVSLKVDVRVEFWVCGRCVPHWKGLPEDRRGG